MKLRQGRCPIRLKQLRELTEAAAQAVDPSLSLSEHAVIIDRTPITRKNLRRLLNNQKSKDMYLDDEIINFYFARLTDRAERHPTLPKIHCYLTQFFESPNRDNWASKITVFDKDIVLIPILIKEIEHWVLVAFYPLIKTVIYYDSLHNDGNLIREQVLQFFKTRFPKETGSALINSEWKSVDETNLPTQLNGFDCGVFVCQMAERLSRRSHFDFEQSQMPAIRIQMIEQIVSGEIPLPSSEQQAAATPRLSRFNMPPSQQITCLETELRALRAKFAAQDIELKELKSNAANQLEDTIKAIANKANEEIQRLQTELAEANRKIEEQKQQMEKFKQDAEKLINRQPNVITKAEVETQIEQERPDSPPPMLDEFPDDTDEPFTKPKTPQSKSSSSSDSSDDSDSDYDQPSTKKRRYLLLIIIEPLPETEDKDLPVCPSAQIPPPPPVPILFGDAVIAPGRVKNGDKNVSIYQPNQEVNLPMVQEPGLNFHRWLHTHGINDDLVQLPAVTQDLELRRRFLVNGDLTQAEKQFIVDRVPPAYLTTSTYLRALAGLALSQYDPEQAFALLFCFSRISNKSLRNFFQRL